MSVVSALLKTLHIRKCLNNSFCTQLSQFSTDTDNPFSKTFNIVKSDFVGLKNKLFNEKTDHNRSNDVFPTHCDVLIIGGGIMGSSVAYWLKQRALDGVKVVVAEKDFTVNIDGPYQYEKASTTLSVGGLRQQFSLKENIELSLFSAEFMRNIFFNLNVEGFDPPDIQFQPSGYLFLASDQSAQILQDNASLQTSLGAKVELLSPEKLKAKFPWINTDGVALGCHGLENEGWFDPWSLLTAFRRKATSLGAQFVEGEITGFQFKPVESESDDYHQLDEATIKLKDGTERSIRFALCILAGGPYSGAVGALAGMGSGSGPLRASLPVEPRKRYVYNIHCPDGPGMNCPLVIDPSGAYFRREGLLGNYLCGRSPVDNEEPPVDNLDVDYDFFENNVWPLIAARCPAFENAKLKSAWAGYYDFNSFDENAFIGLHPGFANLVLATGFSGHGIQQSPAIGRAIMELVLDGKYSTIDLSRLNFERFLESKPLWETNIV